MINVVGIGLDGVEGLSLNVRKIIANSTILIGGERHLSYFLEHPAKQLKLGNFHEIIRQIKDIIETENIVILTSGDPLFFGLGRYLLAEISADKLSFYPHFSSIQLAFNRVKIPWQDAQILSLHGRDLEHLIPLLQQGKEKIGLLTDTNNNPSAIAKLYLSLDLPTNYQFWVCENLGDENTEKISCFTGEKLAELESENFANLNIVILIKIEESNSLDRENLPLFGLPDSVFASFGDRPGLMTKREIRILVLGELELGTKQIIWDIGAGTGSVSLEIGRLSEDSQIYALEKTAIGNSLIKKNCAKLNVKNVIAIQGKAPETLKELPKPDRIFIGGSSGKLGEILEICVEKINSKGIIVLALATLENSATAVNWLTEKKQEYQLLQIQISRSVSVAKLTRLSPLNPVTIIKIKV